MICAYRRINSYKINGKMEMKLKMNKLEHPKAICKICRLKHSEMFYN